MIEVFSFYLMSIELFFSDVYCLSNILTGELLSIFPWFMFVRLTKILRPLSLSRTADKLFRKCYDHSSSSPYLRLDVVSSITLLLRKVISLAFDKLRFSVLNCWHYHPLACFTLRDLNVAHSLLPMSLSLSLSPSLFLSLFLPLSLIHSIPVSLSLRYPRTFAVVFPRSTFRILRTIHRLLLSLLLQNILYYYLFCFKI